MTGTGLGIGEVASVSGVPATALRHYEAIGLLEAPVRVSGRRRYDASVFDRLTVIVAAKQAGFTLAEVAELLAGMTTGAGSVAGSWQAMAAGKLPAVDAAIEDLRRVRRLLEGVAGCGCGDLAECAALLRAPQRRGHD